jgi:hypothetical protein
VCVRVCASIWYSKIKANRCTQIHALIIQSTCEFVASSLTHTCTHSLLSWQQLRPLGLLHIPWPIPAFIPSIDTHTNMHAATHQLDHKRVLLTPCILLGPLGHFIHCYRGKHMACQHEGVSFAGNCVCMRQARSATPIERSSVVGDVVL